MLLLLLLNVQLSFRFPRAASSEPSGETSAAGSETR